MKSIEMRDGEKFKAHDVLGTIINQAGPGGIGVADMRQRIRLLDAVAAATETLLLEDADYDRLKGLVEQFNFGLIHKDLLAVADAVLAATVVNA